MFTLPGRTPGTGPHGLVSDADGNIRFTADSAGYIGKLDPSSGHLIEYRLPDERRRIRIRRSSTATTEANELMATPHPRMPVILHEDDRPAWLGEAPRSPSDLKALLRPYPAENMQAWPVSQRAGNFRNNDAELLTRVEVGLEAFG